MGIFFLIPAMRLVTILNLFACVHFTSACVPRYSPDQCSCGLPLSKRRVVGGTPAAEYQYPWQVGLFANTFNVAQLTCGGSLLSSDTVLTAAHCVQVWGSTAPYVYVGFPQGNVTYKKSKKIRASTVISHPYYDPSGTTTNDLAILKLDTPVVFDDATQPICFPNPNQNYDDVLAEVSGWGATNEYNLLEGSEILLTANMTTITNQECQDLFDNTTAKYKINPNILCTVAEGKSSCFGDSGGPLITLSEDGSYYSQIGVVSFGAGGCPPGYPNAFARVTQQLYWIMKHTSGQTCAPPNSL